MKKLIFTFLCTLTIVSVKSQNIEMAKRLAETGTRLTIKDDFGIMLYLDTETNEYIPKRAFIQKYGKGADKQIAEIQNKMDIEQQEAENRKIQEYLIEEILAIDTYESVSYNKNYYFDLLDRFDGLKDGVIDYRKTAMLFRENIAGLDKNGKISVVSIIEAPQCSKEYIYIQANSWFLNTFNSAKDVIQLNDKEAGVILAKGFLGDIAEQIGFAASYEISAYVLFRIDIKDNRARLITTIQEYESVNRGGVAGAVAAGLNGTTITATMNTYLPNSVYPFVEGMNGLSEKAGAKAYCACCMYMIALKNQLSKAITQGLIGADAEDW